MPKFKARITNYNEAKAFLGNKDRRTLCNNTYAINRGDSIGIVYHRTQIVTYFPSGRTVIDTDGWHTPTTKDRVNQLVPGLGIYQKKHVWYRGTGISFQDGLELLSEQFQSEG